jgi:hypothetical protein
MPKGFVIMRVDRIDWYQVWITTEGLKEFYSINKNGNEVEGKLHKIM